MGKLSFADAVLAAAASLKPGEFWCVMHPDGPLEETASKDMTHPVRVCCEAFQQDWDDLRDQGYYLGRITR